MNKQLKQSILISYLIGAPIGLLVVFLTIYVPVLLTGEGLLTIAVIGAYGISIIGLIISFLIALGIAGKLVFASISKGKSLLLTSFKYSLNVNSIIWTTFCLVIAVSINEEKILMMIPPIIAFIICTILTTFTIGLLMSHTIKRISSKS